MQSVSSYTSVTTKVVSWNSQDAWKQELSATPENCLLWCSMQWHCMTQKHYGHELKEMLTAGALMLVIWNGLWRRKSKNIKIILEQ